MSSERVRVALLGAGKQGNWRHYPNLASFPDVEIVAVCDRHPDRARQTADRWAIPRIYSDYKLMLEETDPQAVYIITSPASLLEPVIYTLQRGKHLFIEKPPGLTLNQARLFAYTAEQNHCVTMVSFQRRFIPAMTALKARVEERGPIHSVSVANLKSTSNLERPASSGYHDQLTGDGMHAVDNLRWLCGGEVERVTSHARALYTPGPFPNAVMAQVEFSSGAVGQLQYCTMSGGSAIRPGATSAGIFRAEIHGKNVSAFVDADRLSYIVADSGEPEILDPKSFARDIGTEPEHYLGFWHLSREFIDCVKDGRQPSCNFADAVKTWELIDRIHEASG